MKKAKPKRSVRRFRLTTRAIPVTRFERFYFITDKNGDRVYTGTDKKAANLILRKLNAYYQRKARAKTTKKGKRK